MQRFKKEACRNFQRGFCQYGDRCKFLHDERQTFPNNQTSNNQFSFGSASQPPPQKPFENKWSRFSSNPTTSQHQQHHSDSNPQAPTNHDCVDPDSCKRIISDDFKNERPLWKLTCYGHWKGIPCDITGDISKEELRAAAYDEAKRGLPLPSIVERERNLVKAKLSEYENLLRSRNTNTTPSLSSFSQLGAALNLSSQTNPQPKLIGNAFNGSGTANRPQVAGSATNTRSYFGFQAGNAPKLEPVKEPAPLFPSLPIKIPLLEENATVLDLSVWENDKWTIGEIPEDAPPDNVLF